jgi:hypothetical protein
MAVLVLSAAACEPPTVPPRRAGNRTVAFLPPETDNHRGWAEPVTTPTPPPQSRAPLPPDVPQGPADPNVLDGRRDSAFAALTDDKIELRPSEQGIAGAGVAARDSAERGRQQQTKGGREQQTKSRRQESAPAQPSAPMPVVAELARALEERDAESMGVSAPPPVERILRQEKARFQRCYDALVLRDPATLPGSLSVRLVLGPAGDIQQVEVVSGTLQDPDFHDCIMTKLTALSFPRNDAMLDFTYPFRFGAPGGEESVE